MLIFNKQYQTEKKIIEELTRKLDTGENFFQRIEGNQEIYEIIGMWIIFDFETHELRVDSAGKTIFELDCNYGNDKLQSKRFNWFSELLEKHARKRWDAELKNKEKVKKKSAKLKSAIKMAKIKQQRNMEIQKLQESLKQIKEL